MSAHMPPSARPRRPLATLRGVSNAGINKSARRTPLRPGQRQTPSSAAPASATAPGGSRRCPQCDSTDIQEDDGFIICQSCFTQIGEANIVADVTFEEQAGGRSTVQGGFVSDNARHAKTLGAGAYRKVGGGERNSLAEIESAGRRALGTLTPKLGIAENVAQQANSIWGLAAGINFSAGRKTDEVVGACLYAACRRQADNEVLLMDISELLEINVFRLGEVYRDLCNELYLSDESVGFQHLIELEPLIWKYCRKLQFEDKTKDVATDALKIMKRMTRDWIVAGRHPAGLCGACIILAARMNNFRRSVREVVWVSKVADVTIAKRVEEFRRTKSAALTVDQFREYGPRLKHEHDPPSFNNGVHRKKIMEGRKKKRREHMLRTGGTPTSETAPAAMIEIIDEGDDSDNASSRSSSEEPVSTADGDGANGDEADADKAQHTDRSPQDGGQTSATFPPTPPTTQEIQSSTVESEAASSNDQSSAKRRHQPDGLDPTSPYTLGTGTDTGSLSKEPIGDKRQNTEAGPSKARNSAQQEVRYDADGFAIPALPIDPAISKPLTKRRKKNDPPPVIDLSKEELLSERELELEIESALDNEEVIDSRNEVEKAKDEERAHLLAIQQKQIEADRAEARRKAEGVQFGKAPDWNPGDVLDEMDLEKEFENDPEVLNCQLSPEETRVKEQIWVAHNEDWLRKQVEKEMLNQARANNPQSQKSKKGDKARKRRGKMGDGSVLTEHSTPIETPADAAKAMLQKRAPQKSAHVDFLALERIYGRKPLSHRSSESGSRSATASREQTPASTGADRPRDEVDEANSANNEDGADADAHATGGAEDKEDDEEEGEGEGAEDEDAPDMRSVASNLRLPGWADIDDDDDDEQPEDDDEAEEDDYRFAMRFGRPKDEQDEFGLVGHDYEGDGGEDFA